MLFMGLFERFYKTVACSISQVWQPFNLISFEAMLLLMSSCHTKIYGHAAAGSPEVQLNVFGTLCSEHMVYSEQKALCGA